MLRSGNVPKANALHVDLNITHQKNCSVLVEFLRVNVTDPRTLLLNYSIVQIGEDPVGAHNGTGSLDPGITTIGTLFTPDPVLIVNTTFVLLTYVVNNDKVPIQVINKTFDVPRCLSASAKRDPHLTTFDGRHFGYQGLCWHTLVKDCRNVNPRFEVTGKFEPREMEGPELRSRTTQVNVRMDDHLISLTRDNHVLVNGRAVYTPKFRIDDDNIKVYRQADHVTFKLSEAELVLEWYGRDHSLYATLTSADYIGKVCGLLGNADGDARNDFTKRDGDITKDVVEFGESWRISELGC
ncbi:BMP-binding endothelial regulator protein-like [Ptychodera flava]|uniref:BMP-binding endothelial regulator protein-like n=1 Tax=Ptychodera flava TaxID=63121 RepID=UPI00396A9F86